MVGSRLSLWLPQMQQRCVLMMEHEPVFEQSSRPVCLLGPGGKPGALSKCLNAWSLWVGCEEPSDLRLMGMKKKSSVWSLSRPWGQRIQQKEHWTWAESLAYVLCLLAGHRVYSWRLTQQCLAVGDFQVPGRHGSWHCWYNHAWSQVTPLVV